MNNEQLREELRQAIQICPGGNHAELLNRCFVALETPQHARDSAELRRLCAERDQIKAALKRLEAGMPNLIERNFQLRMMLANARERLEEVASSYQTFELMQRIDAEISKSPLQPNEQPAMALGEQQWTPATTYPPFGEVVMTNRGPAYMTAKWPGVWFERLENIGMGRRLGSGAVTQWHKLPALGEQQSVPGAVWRSMESDPPKKTGRYCVGHCGNFFGHAYYTARAGDTHYPVGWNQVPKWRPSHWLDVPYIGDAAPSPVQSACKLVPVELLEELRDAANEAHNEATLPSRMKFFAALVEKADAMLASAQSAPKADPVKAQTACEVCDGTGDVHRPDGEWLGKCPFCDLPASPAIAAALKEGGKV